MTTTEVFKVDGSEVVSREIGDELIVMHFRSSAYLSVNEAGMALWAKLLDGATVDDLVGELTNSYDVDAATATADVESFLEDLRSRDLLSQG